MKKIRLIHFIQTCLAYISKPIESVKKVEHHVESAPVSFTQLFRYATPYERLLSFAGVLLSVVASLGVPAFDLLFSEVVGLFAERNTEAMTSTTSDILSPFGGGRVLVNGTFEERMTALEEDTIAFVKEQLIVIAFQISATTTSIYFLNKSAIRQVRRIRVMFLTSLMRQDQAWHDTHQTADVATRLTDDLEKLQDCIGEKIGIFTYHISSFVTSVSVSMYCGWKLTLTLLACSPIIIVVHIVLEKMQCSLLEQEVALYGAAGRVVDDVIAAIKTVVAFGGEQKEVERYDASLKSAQCQSIKRSLCLGIGEGSITLFTFAMYALTSWYGMQLILDDRPKEVKDYTPSSVLIVIYGVLVGLLNTSSSTTYFEAFDKAKSSASFVYHVIEHSPGIDSLGEVGARPDHVTGDIELRGVTFGYPTRPEVKVLDGLDLTVSHGKTVALVGHSDCGKSTVLQLIQRLYDPAQGSVLVDGVDVRELNVQWLRGRIVVVAQEPVLFDVTIRENIRYGAGDATDNDVEEAAREANAHDFISQLPQGYDTMMSNNGAQLSGGQKQRVAIARALVRRPAVLLLDEATSALDRASEVEVKDRACQGRTTIMASHRLATVRHADVIAVMCCGRVVEQGTHDELMTSRGQYYKMFQGERQADSAVHETVEDLEVRKNSVVNSESHKQNSEKATISSLSKKNSCKKEIDEEHLPSAISRVLALNKPEWIHILLGCVTTFVLGCCMPAYAVLYGYLYGLLRYDDVEDIRWHTNVYCCGMLAIGVIGGVILMIQTYIFGLVGARLTTRLRTQVFSAILSQDMGWFEDERNSVGALSASLAGDAASVQGATATTVCMVLQAFWSLSAGLVVAMCFNWKLTLLTASILPIVLIVVYLGTNYYGGSLVEKETLVTATKIAVEAITHARTVASQCGESFVLSRYETQLTSALEAGGRKRRLRGVVFALGQTLPHMTYVLSVWYGGSLIAHADMPYEYVIIVIESLFMGTWLVGQSISVLPNILEAMTAATRLFNLQDGRPIVNNPAFITINDNQVHSRLYRRRSSLSLI